MTKRYVTVATYPSSSKSGKVYEVKRDEQGNLSCNCPSWIFNQKGNRTCYHTMAYLASCVEAANPPSGTFSASGTFFERRVIESARSEGLLGRTSQDDITPSKVTGEPKRKVRLEGI